MALSLKLRGVCFGTPRRGMNAADCNGRARQAHSKCAGEALMPSHFTTVGLQISGVIAKNDAYIADLVDLVLATKYFLPREFLLDPKVYVVVFFTFSSCFQTGIAK